MEATCSSETVVDFQRTAWLYIPENRNIHSKEVVVMKYSSILQDGLKISMNTSSYLQPL
jgi:hypothetical protein